MKMDNKITGSETSIGIADEIAKLKKLLDDGILTQDEYDQQKSRLLNNTPTESTNSASSPQNQGLQPSPEKPKKTGKGCLISVLIVLLVIAGIISVVTKITENSNNATSSNTTSTSAESWREFDDRTWADFKNLYVSHSRLLQNVSLFSEGRVSKLELYDSMKQAKEYFRKAAMSFDYGNNSEEKTYLSSFSSMALSDQMATESIMKYLDKGNISDLSKATDHLEDAKEAALLIASNRGTLLVRAGYTQEEISEKINSEMAELEEQISNGGNS